tara:strand:+ start:2178 stop:2450 length:273 start_codon:yes stop_codon:yes gene_type:complete
MIPNHQRENYERSDHLIHVIKHLQAAAYEMVGNLEIIPEHRGLMDTVLAMLDVADEKISALEHARQLEWVGLGGKNETLSESDLNKARGD